MPTGRKTSIQTQKLKTPRTDSSEFPIYGKRVAIKAPPRSGSIDFNSNKLRRRSIQQTDWPLYWSLIYISTTLAALSLSPLPTLKHLPVRYCYKGYSYMYCLDVCLVWHNVMFQCNLSAKRTEAQCGKFKFHFVDRISGGSRMMTSQGALRSSDVLARTSRAAVCTR